MKLLLWDLQRTKVWSNLFIDSKDNYNEDNEEVVLPVSLPHNILMQHYLKNFTLSS